MSKYKLGTGAKKGVIKRPNTSYASPREIQIRRRRAAMLDQREAGKSYREIARNMRRPNRSPPTLAAAALKKQKQTSAAGAIRKPAYETKLDALEGNQLLRACRKRLHNP
jgi:hypothetical protein